MNPIYRIKDICREDQPRERLTNVGPGSLSNGELRGILLGSGMPGVNAVQLGQRLLKALSGLDGYTTVVSRKCSKSEALVEPRRYKSRQPSS